MSQATRRSALGRKRPYTVPPGGPTGPGAWQITPDQRDRNSEYSAKAFKRRRVRPRTPNPYNQQWS